MADAAVAQLRALFSLALRSLPGEEGWAGGGFGRPAGCGVLEERGEGGAGLPGKWDLSLQQQQKASSLGWGVGPPPSAPPAGPRHIFQAPSTHLPALSCISCKHQHFLWGEGLAVLGGGGATPGGQQAQHTMAGPGLRLAPPTARAFPVTQRNATLGESWTVGHSPGAGGARQVCRATQGPPPRHQPLPP